MVRTCAERIEAGDAPILFPGLRSGSVFAGPLAFSGYFPRTSAALGSRGEDGRYWVKVGALVRAGRPVVLSVPARHRGVLVLHYARDGDGEPVVRIEPCPRPRPPSLLRRRGRAGDRVQRRLRRHPAGLYPLDVAVVGGRSYRVRLSLGQPLPLGELEAHLARGDVCQLEPHLHAVAERQVARSAR